MVEQYVHFSPLDHNQASQTVPSRQISTAK